jgi:hypothetical protein
MRKFRPLRGTGSVSLHLFFQELTLLHDLFGQERVIAAVGHELLALAREDQ